MTLSARASTFGGIVRPICFAAFRLMMNSNFVGCSTGRSAGFVLFRFLFTNNAYRSSRSVCVHMNVCGQRRKMLWSGKVQWSRHHSESASTLPDGLFERLLVFVGAAYFH